jgi:hypothetical protein
LLDIRGSRLSSEQFEIEAMTESHSTNDLLPTAEACRGWAIGILRGPSPLALDVSSGIRPVLTAALVTDVSALFVADPFLIRHFDRWYLFFEVKLRNAREGVIACAESTDCLHWSYRQVVLREPFHLSYPHVFSWRDEYYMTPETLGGGQIRLYRAVNFPDKWEHVRDLVPGEHADPSIFEAEGSWWMFSCNPRGSHSTLRLYHADTPLGPWTEHPRSPIIVRNRQITRPAGRVIAWNGSLLRFTQDCEQYYGRLVRGFRITQLTPTTYSEEPVTQNPVLGPGPHPWNRWGMHHIDAQPGPDGGCIAAVDGF